MRISSNSVSVRMTRMVQESRRSLFEVQERVGSGLRINRPADDPQATGRVMAQRTTLELNGQYRRNADLADAELAVSEQALASLGSVLQRAQELATQGATGSIGASERRHIGVEVGQLLNQAVTLGNTRHAGRYMFAGHRTGTAPFVPDLAAYPGAVTYVGDTGEITRELGQGDRMVSNLTGDRTFSAAYTTLIQLRDDLMGNNAAGISAGTSQVQARLEESLTLRSEIGAKARRVEVAREQLDDADGMLRTLIAGLEEADLTENIVDLQRREVALNAALGATGRVLNMSLLEFLR